MKAPITYCPQVFRTADTLFNELQLLAWQRRDNTPRMEYYCNDFHEPYTYGKGAGQRTYQPQPWTPAITDIRFVAQALAETLRGDVKFEVCFLNRYLDQKDQLGWHADNSPEMDDARPIAIVSFGAEREIWFRGLSNLKEVEKLTLGHGSVCIMAPGMQDTHQHRIPKAGRVVGERISLTFRGYVKS